MNRNQLNPLIYLVLFSLMLISKASAYEAPYSLKKFHSILNHSKLQWPDSSMMVPYSQFEDFSAHYFYLSHRKYMTFRLSKSRGFGKPRVELRQGPDAWKTSITSVKKMVAEVKCFEPDSLEEFTWMQIHGTSQFNKPLLRLLWKKYRKGKSDHLWAVVRTSFNKEYKWFDLGKRTRSFFKVEVKVKKNNLVVKINKKKKLEYNVSYWQNIDSYFKAGLYLNAKNDAGDAKVQFKTLKYD